MVQIYCVNNGKTLEFPTGCELLDIYPATGVELPYPVISARVNNVAQGLGYKVYNNKSVEYLDVRDPSAMRTYVRSLCFVLYKAVSELFSNVELFIRHPVSNGYYCSVNVGRTITVEDVSAIKNKMKEIIAADIPFKLFENRVDDAIQIFKGNGRNDKVKLLETSGALYTRYHKLGDTVDSYYGNLVPSTGFLYLFDIVKYYDGLLLRIPSHSNPDKLDDIIKQEQMLDVFKEHLQWNHILNLETVGDLNNACQKGYATRLINVAEALQEKKIAQIAEQIYHRADEGRPVKLVLISGPSSSGKTTFSKRLSVQLLTNGILPYPISLDNYFLPREETPKDENGDYDYESIYALDLELFNSQMQAILRGEEVELPYYNFQTGKREYRGQKLQLRDNMVLVMEGNHGLNPELTPQIPDDNKFKIYVSALTTIALDYHNWIPTTDNRLVRRIIRDFNYRGYSAQQTIARWQIEFAVFRSHVEPILNMVPQNCREYAEAYRLLKFMRYFYAIRDNEIPHTSLLREFIGGSSFVY